MRRMTDSEWAVMDVLWSGERFSLGEVMERLQPVTGWSRNTVFTYLTRMEKKNLVTIDRTQDKPYLAAMLREDCAKGARNDLLKKVYGGATGDLVVAFLKETKISPEERDRLRAMLDNMEV